MIKIFTSSIACTLLTASISNACPDLSGTWTCHDVDNGPFTISITQEPLSAKGTIYHFDKPVSGTIDVTADGRPYPFVDGGASGTQTATCTSASTLSIYAVAKEASGNFEYDIITTANKTDANHFELSIDGVVKIPDQPDQAVATRTPCEL